ncbi:peroxidase 29 [Magnolia sinica]|uniref:peroxidase 29 n=1 Tax=Magnolia sinica TaxID=86752 RepID=UPI002658826D|nr:peroxidase 29 [Magnolia sinica]
MKRVAVVLFVVCMICFHEVDGVGLSYDFYEKSCPQVEMIVKQGLGSVFLLDPTIPAALLRLLFHDCQVQGCDASILLDDTNITSEMASAKNFGIRGRESIGIIKSMVEKECPQTVSCSDILVLAARDAVASSGGPQIRVPLGRRDAITSSYHLADASLPLSTTGVDEMLRIFTAKGMSVEESVAILGAHTIGITHCINVIDSLDRPKSHNRRTESHFQSFLKFSCPKAIPAAKSFFVGNDLTNFAFDNQYYRDTISGRGNLRIDSDMTTDPRTAPIVACFAVDQAYFFQSFTSAFLKLSSYSVLTGNQGGVHRSCNRVD